MNYCSDCGAHVTLRVPDGDDRPRFVCDNCATVHYENPKMVVGCIPEWNGEILLCRRAIQPGYGKWTLPAGYLENGETVYEGAKREAWEEAGIKLRDLQPFVILNLSFISQVYLMFRAKLLTTEYSAGSESLEIRLFGEEEIPWEQMAFPAVCETLKLYLGDRPKGEYPFRIRDLRPSSRFVF